MSIYYRKGIDYYLRYAFPIIILIFTFSLIYGWAPRLRNIALLFLGLLIGLLTSSKYYRKPMLLAFLTYFFVLYINRVTGDFWISDNLVVFDELFKLVLTGLMGYAMLISRDDRFLKITIVSFLLMLVVNVIGTSIVETVVPGSIRTLEQWKHEGDYNSIMFYFRYGMANYALPSGLVTIIPMLVLGIKMNAKNKKKRILLFIGLVSSLMLTYYSGSTAALILGVFGVLVGIFVKQGTGKGQLFSLAVFGVLLTFFLSNDILVLSFLDIVDGWVGGEGYFHQKVLDFETLTVYGEIEGSMAGREDLYLTTWKAIVENPILGTNSEIGGHSLLLDHWGYLGLVGFIPFLVFVISQIKLFFRLIPDSTKLIYAVCVFITFMMMAVKNMNTWESWLCLFTILPLLAVYCSSEASASTSR